MAQANPHNKPILRRAVTSPAVSSSTCRTAAQENSQYPATRTGYIGRCSESDRYCTASSDEDYDDYDADEMCIRLDSDDDDGSLSGFHIDLKTLQAVSTMLVHYSPIIQSDIFGNPTFVPPPPPPDDEYYEEDKRRSYRSPTKPLPSLRKHSSRLASDFSYSSTLTGGDDYQFAIQELEDVLLNQENPRLSDAMTELTDVMEKMTRFTEEMENNE